MRHALALALSAAAIALTGAAGSSQAADGAYVAPRTSLGQPDLQGYWTNASITPESRPAALGNEAVFTPAEVAQREGAAIHEAKELNKPTDPHAPPPSVGGDPLPPGTRPEFAAGGGNPGGYTYGWLDPGRVVMRVHGEPRTSIITTPNGRAPAFKAGVSFPRGGGYGLGSFDNVEQRSLGERCIMSFGRTAPPPMLANGFYNHDYEIVQGRDTVAIFVEMVHDVRIVRMNGTHRTDGLRPYMGDSIGHWEGDTLVVETTNFPQSDAYHGSWKNLKVTERFTRVAANRLLYQFVVDDPTMWDQPWGGEYEFGTLKGIVYEYACHEGNYALEDMLAGARAEEAAAAAKAKPTPASATVAH